MPDAVIVNQLAKRGIHFIVDNPRKVRSVGAQHKSDVGKTQVGIFINLLLLQKLLQPFV